MIALVEIRGLAEPVGIGLARPDGRKAHQPGRLESSHRAITVRLERGAEKCSV